MANKCEYNLHEQINALRYLKALGLNIHGLKVAILDSAIDTRHCILSHADINIFSEKEIKPSYHGTAVASLVVGKKIGIAPQTKILSIPVFNENKQGHLDGCSELKLARAINKAREKGCQIINISGSALSQTGNGTDQLRQAIDACVKNDILVIAAVGNNGLRSESIPASMDGVIAIGAHDIQGQAAQFNNHGAKLHKKMLLAPGVDIPIELQQGQFAHISGTSFAAPIVSAIVALILQAIRSVNGTYTATQIQTLLQNASTISCQHRKAMKRLDLVRLLQQLQDDYPLLKTQSNDLTPRSISMKPTEIDSTTAVEPAMDQSSIQPADAEKVTGNTVGSEQVSTSDSSASSMSMPMQKINDPAANNFVHGTPVDRNVIQPQSANYESNIQADEKVFALGEIGYDFLTETNLDYFQQAMQSAPEQARGTGIPSDEVSMAKFLNYNANGHQPYVENCTALTWILKVDGIPIYAIRPQNQFAIMAFGKLVNFLIGKHGLDPEELNKSSSEEVIQLRVEAKKDQAASNENKIDIVSIAGSIVDEIRLYNGHVVPVVSPILRGMFAWSPEHITSALHYNDNSDKNAKKIDMLTNFLNRVYYELRNRGASPMERAINYAATNAYQAGEVFEDVLSDNAKYVLNRISAEKSPVCRPEADCWDVMLEFFNPQNRTEEARKIYRYTIDVSGLMPVTFGKLRSWYAY
ncbi:MAG: PatA/PatG family cyanobactin maturation protease [Endozoicomonadaceae bacterium]|nr:PatA/PatG family cyanobactin maturation protease [Endozoicomonadaceae bacterium]